jgi:acetylornithine/succinyldiaminopimelate/putrescine aminotransferase
MMPSHLAQVFSQYPLKIARAAGCHLYTDDGREILDFYGGHAVAALGYGHPRWLNTLHTQAQTVLFQTNAIPMDIREQAADALVQFSQLALERVFFINSGAEANENALRIAFRLTGRRQAIALEQGWHGRTAAAGAVTDGAADKWYHFPQKPFDVQFVSRTDASAATQAITTDTACVIVEPVQGLAGAYDITPEFLKALRQRCDETGTLLIFDEVQCGVGRTGFPFGANRANVTPDLLTTAKALGAGFPVSALMMRESIARQLPTESLGTTFGGGPMACAIVKTVLEIIEQEHLLHNVLLRSAEIQRLVGTGPVIGVQGAGLLMGLRCSRPAKEVQRELLRKNIFAGTAADPAIVRLLPPYTLTASHVDQLAQALKEIAS